MRKMMVTQEELSAAMAEWLKHHRKEPDSFLSGDEFKKVSTASYGKRTASYLFDNIKLRREREAKRRRAAI